MNEKLFYKMLAELHEVISDQSCGCMGCNYTPENVKESQPDYLSTILKKYINVEVEMNKCKHWPDEHSGCVCDCGSDVSGSHTCTYEDQLTCQWSKEANERH